MRVSRTVTYSNIKSVMKIAGKIHWGSWALNLSHTVDHTHTQIHTNRHTHRSTQTQAIHQVETTPTHVDTHTLTQNEMRAIRGPVMESNGDTSRQPTSAPGRSP